MCYFNGVAYLVRDGVFFEKKWRRRSQACRLLPLRVRDMGEEGPQDGASALDRPLAGKAHAHEKEKVLLLCTRGVTFRWVKGGKPFGRKIDESGRW